MLAYLYRGYVIRVEVEQNLETLNWESLNLSTGARPTLLVLVEQSILLRPKRKLNTPSFNRQRDGSMVT